MAVRMVARRADLKVWHLVDYSVVCSATKLVAETAAQTGKRRAGW